MTFTYEFFAHNYSYSKQETMQLTIPEALFFYKQTQKRQKIKAIDEISKYEILLAIATNPHIKASEARKLPNEFKRIKMKLENRQAKPQDIEKNLNRLKGLLGSR
jgi:hypothetical protein